MRYTALIVLSACCLSAQVKVTKQDSVLSVTIDGKPLTALHYGPQTMKPYLHPLHAASGTIVTRRWPMETVDGESKDHPHHEGIWFTHGDVNGHDFWAKSKDEKKQGKITVDRVEAKSSGKDRATIFLEARWIDGTGKAILKEDRTMTFYRDRKIDFDIKLTALGEPVKFGDTKEGTFAIRLADSLTEKRKGGVLTNAEGAQGMANVWGKPSPWVDYSGKIADEAVGVTILDHPENPGYPTTWHARDYGLFAANIFGQRDFTRDANKDGSLTLAPGKSIRFRYRLLIHTGDAKSAGIPAAAEMYR